MSEVQVSTICESQTVNGYILKNFFTLVATKGTPVVCFEAGQISSVNETADHNLLVSSYLNGEEIRMFWSPEIPFKDRKIFLKVESKQVISIFSKIKKKDGAKIILRKIEGKTSSIEDCNYIIFVITGEGGDQREGAQRIPAIQVELPDMPSVKIPDIRLADCLYIPIKDFRQMVDSYSKCKNCEIKIHFYSNPGSLPGVLMTTGVGAGSKTDPIIEKYGYLPEENSSPSSPLGKLYMGDLKFDESAIIRSNGESSVKLVCQGDILEPSDFIIRSDKIPIFVKFASMHSEGGVRIYYTPDYDLAISYRFGAFGESALFIPKGGISLKSD